MNFLKFNWLSSTTTTTQYQARITPPNQTQPPLIIPPHASIRMLHPIHYDLLYPTLLHLDAYIVELIFHINYHATIFSLFFNSRFLEFQYNIEFPFLDHFFFQFNCIKGDIYLIIQVITFFKKQTNQHAIFFHDSICIVSSHIYL